MFMDAVFSFGERFSYLSSLLMLMLHKSQLTHDKILTRLLKSMGRADIRIHMIRREAKNRQDKLRDRTESSGPAVIRLVMYWYLAHGVETRMITS